MDDSITENRRIVFNSIHSKHPFQSYDSHRRQSSPGNNSVDYKDDDSNSCSTNGGHYDGLSISFPVDDVQQRPVSGDATSYRKRRIKNNEAARKSREKRRRLDAELRHQLDIVIAENRALRYQLKLLRAVCGLPPTDGGAGSGTNATLTASANTGPLQAIDREATSGIHTWPPAPSPSIQRSAVTWGFKQEPIKCRTPSSSPGHINRGDGTSTSQTGLVSFNDDVQRATATSSGHRMLEPDGRIQSSGSSFWRNNVGFDYVSRRPVVAEGARNVGTSPHIGVPFSDTEPLNLSTDSFRAPSKKMLCV